MKLLSRLFKITLIFFIVVLLAALAFAVTFDANNYKTQITEQVQKATGRDFDIAGDIELSLFPWIGLSVNQVRLGNEKGFSAAHFAAIKQLDIKVKLLPLLKKEVQIDTIRLHGLDVSLEVAEDKSTNWSSLAPAETAAQAAVPPADETQQQTGAAVALQSLKVEGFEFVDAVMHYHDRSSDSSVTVSELDLKTGAIEFEQPVALSFSAHINKTRPAIDSRVKLDTELTFNKTFTVFNLRDVVLTVSAAANEFIKQDEQLQLRSSIDVYLDEQRLDVKHLQLSALGTETVATVVVTQLMQTPLIVADIEVLPFDARKLASRAGVELPVMAKADALQQLAMKTAINMQAEKLEANDFSLQLDGSTLSGWIHLIDINSQQLRYELAFDRLDIDDYLPPAAAATTVETTSPDKDTAGSSVAGSAAPEGVNSGDEKIELPLEMMRKLDVQGDLRITQLRAAGYDISQFLMSSRAKQGEITVKPLSMQLLDGQLNSALIINVQKAVPLYAMELDASQLQAGPVVNPLLVGIMGDEPLTVEGAVNVVMGLKTSGETVNQLKKASLGQIVLDMQHTEVKGFDPEYFMRSSLAAYLDQKAPGLSQTVSGDYQPRQVTVFDSIHSTINVKDGKARTDDFLMDSKRLQVTAKGHVDIIQDSVDITSSVKLSRDKTTVEKILNEPVYVRVHGPFAALSYDLDSERLKQSTSDLLANEAKAKLDAEKQRLKAKAEEERRRAEEKARQELKETTDKYQDKLKNKLKGLF